MNKKTDLIKKIIVWIVLAIMLMGTLATVIVYAADFSTSASGPSTIEKGESFTVTLSFSSSVSVSGIEGSLSYDKSKLTLSSSSGSSIFTATVGERIVAYLSDFSSNGATSSSFVKLNFTATSGFVEGESTTISFSGVSGTATTDDDVYDIDGSGCSIIVSIPKSETPTTTQPEPQPKPSTDTSNSKNDSPNSDTSENKSSNNKLESLAIAIENAKLVPEFSPDTTEYTLNVTNSVDMLDLSAIAKDNKANVEIKNNTLINNAITNVEIRVTAENGDVKIYMIKVQKGNYEDSLSDNCDLAEIKLSYGNLSPLFDKDVLNYVVSVPYDLESITFDATPESPNATCNVIGEAKLNAGEENSYHIVCTAEDGKTTKIYNITVISTHSYETFISKYFIDSVVNQINNNVNPIVLDLSGADVQIISKDIFEALRGKENTTLIIRTKNGTVTFNSDELVYEINEKYYDLTMIKSSIYSDNMLPSLASYENYVFSTHHKSELPGFATFSVYTEFVKGTKVNVYMYEEEDNSYIIAAKNVEVGDGGVVAFEIDKGGDFIITTKDVSEAGEYHSVNRESNKETLTKTMLFIIGVAFCLLVGFSVGFSLNRSGKNAKRVKHKKATLKSGNNQKEKSKETELSEEKSETNEKSNQNDENASEDRNSILETLNEEQTQNSENKKVADDDASQENIEQVDESVADLFSEDDENVDEMEQLPKKEKKKLFGRKKDLFKEADEDVSDFEAMLDEFSNKKH